jgi:predicted nucleotidyltransferase
LRFNHKREVALPEKTVTLTIALLERWAQGISDELKPAGVYVFGSLIYRNGEQFGENSDVDLVVIMPAVPDAVDRTEWLERLLEKKIELEDLLGRLLRRDRKELICSVVAVTALEVAADAHKDGAPNFFAANLFYDLLASRQIDGLPNAGSRVITERLILGCARFAQKQRNTYLGANALGDATLKPFDDAEDPAPKAIMRHAAMVQFLKDDGDADPGSEFDLNIGADFLTVMLHDRRARLGELGRRYATRRRGRGELGPLTTKDQLVLSELVLDAAIKLEARAAAVAAEPKRPLLRGEHSTVLFAKRFAAAFPGVRGIKWFEDPDDIRQRLGKLLEEPLEYEDGTPIWWTRGGTNLHISSASIVGDVLVINDDEMRIRRVAAVNAGAYKHNFVLLDVAPLPPIGIYEHTAGRIAEVARGEGPFPYYWEEYGLVDGKYLITRGELDDGSAIINGKLQSVSGRVSYRGRYVTDYNCIVAGGGAPVLDQSYDEQLESKRSPGAILAARGAEVVAVGHG